MEDFRSWGTWIYQAVCKWQLKDFWTWFLFVLLWITHSFSTVIILMRVHTLTQPVDVKICSAKTVSVVVLVNEGCTHHPLYWYTNVYIKQIANEFLKQLLYCQWCNIFHEFILVVFYPFISYVSLKYDCVRDWVLVQVLVLAAVISCEACRASCIVLRALMWVDYKYVQAIKVPCIALCSLLVKILVCIIQISSFIRVPRVFFVA